MAQWAGRGRQRTRNTAEPWGSSCPWTPTPHPLQASSPSPPGPHSPCPPHHSRAAETTQGRSAGEGGGTGQQGTGGGGGQLNPRACALPQLLRLQTLLTDTLPNCPPTTQPGAEAGPRPGGRGAPTLQSRPTCHMQGGGQPAGKSCLGFSYSVGPPALSGVSRETEHPSPHPDTWLRLLGCEAGLCDPGPVTEAFCPSAEKGSLVPESGLQWQKANKSLHPPEYFSFHSAQEAGQEV